MQLQFGIPEQPYRFLKDLQRFYPPEKQTPALWLDSYDNSREDTPGPWTPQSITTRYSKRVFKVNNTTVSV